MTSSTQLRMAMVTTLMPETHYSRYLIEAMLDKLRGKLSILVYSNKEERVLGLEGATISQCWSQNFLYPFQIARQAIKDKVHILHLQHEINMYGGPATAIMFPILVLLLKLSRKRVVVTIHAVVPRKEIDSGFLDTFAWVQSRLTVIMVKSALFYVYCTTCWVSDLIIVHSNYLKLTLASDYGAKNEKIFVIPHGVPVRNGSQGPKGIDAIWWEKINDRRVILNFGYVVRRKGLEYLIEAFEKINKDHPEYVLIIAGGSLRGQEDYVSSLMNLVEERELSEKVIFTSFITDVELQHSSKHLSSLSCQLYIPYRQAVHLHKQSVSISP